jgi:hypothetical protein
MAEDNCGLIREHAAATVSYQLVAKKFSGSNQPTKVPDRQKTIENLSVSLQSVIKPMTYGLLSELWVLTLSFRYYRIFRPITRT